MISEKAQAIIDGFAQLVTFDQPAQIEGGDGQRIRVLRVSGTYSRDLDWLNVSWAPFGEPDQQEPVLLPQRFEGVRVRFHQTEDKPLSQAKLVYNVFGSEFLSDCHNKVWAIPIDDTTTPGIISDWCLVEDGGIIEELLTEKIENPRIEVGWYRPSDSQLAESPDPANLPIAPRVFNSRYGSLPVYYWNSGGPVRLLKQPSESLLSGNG